MEVLIESKREPFIFLSNDDTLHYVSYSPYKKYITNDINEIKIINSELNHLLQLFFMGNLPESQYIHIIKLCNILNPDNIKFNPQYHNDYLNLVFQDYHCHDCTTRDYHVRMFEIHNERHKFKKYLDWYVYTNEMTKKVVKDDFSGYCERARLDKIDFLRLLTEVLSQIFFHLNSIKNMFTVKILLYKKLEYYFRDNIYLNIDNDLLSQNSRQMYLSKGDICLLNNDLIDYLQEIYGNEGLYERMIEKMQNLNIDEFYRREDIYTKDEILEKYRVLNGIREINYDESKISEFQKEKMIEIIECFLKGKNQSKNLHHINELFNRNKYWNKNYACLEELEYRIYDFGSIQLKKKQIKNVFNELNLPFICDELLEYLNLNQDEKDILGIKYFNFLYQLFLIFKRKIPQQCCFGCNPKGVVIPHLNDSSNIYFLYLLQKYIHLGSLMQLKMIYSTHCFFQISQYPNIEIDIIRF